MVAVCLLRKNVTGHLEFSPELDYLKALNFAG
jgi:hypothetical protein